MQVHEALQMRLQLRRRHPGNGEAVVVPELDQGIAMRVAGNVGRQLLQILDVSEMIELDGVGLRIEVADRLGAHARMKHEAVVAGAADGDGAAVGVWRCR